jgi:hypothetical protein
METLLHLIQIPPVEAEVLKKMEIPSDKVYI